MMFGLTNRGGGPTRFAYESVPPSGLGADLQDLAESVRVAGRPSVRVGTKRVGRESVRVARRRSRASRCESREAGRARVGASRGRRVGRGRRVAYESREEGPCSGGARTVGADPPPRPSSREEVPRLGGLGGLGPERLRRRRSSRPSAPRTVAADDSRRADESRSGPSGRRGSS